MWSEPRRVSERMLNSYKLETVDGQPLEGEYPARRLRGFTPREGTELALQQKEVEATNMNEERTGRIEVEEELELLEERNDEDTREQEENTEQNYEEN
jgi:hypothetical protein